VGRFIAVTHENPRLAAPFLTIMQSFNDLAQRSDPPLFSTNLKPRERERSSQRKHLPMIAAVAMEVLMALEHSLEDAAQQVAAAVQKWPAFHAQTITSQQFATGETKFAHQLMGAIPSSSSCRIIFLGSSAQSRR
jgi:hypothetical protein